MKKLNVAVVGCGLVAQQRHIPILKKLNKSISIQAVCDTNESLAQQAAKNYKIPKIYTDLSEMLLKEDLDVIDICTPPQTHAPLAIQSMEHGCHVLLEKPMAFTTADCDEIVTISQKEQVKLCVIHNQLFNSPLIEARKLIAKGAIGDFVGMRILMFDPRDIRMLDKDNWAHKLAGGVIGETGPHAVYLSLAFIDCVRNVDVFARNFLEHPWSPFDEFRIELEGEKASSSIAISYTSTSRASYLDLLGTEGVLHLDLLSMLLIHQRGKESMKPLALTSYPLNAASQIVKGTVANAFKVITGRARLGHEVIIEGFVDAILNDHRPPVTGEEGRETIRVMEMIVSKLRDKYED